MGTCLDRGIKVVVERRRARPRRLRRGGRRGGRAARACRRRSPTSSGDDLLPRLDELVGRRRRPRPLRDRRAARRHVPVHQRQRLPRLLGHRRGARARRRHRRHRPDHRRRHRVRPGRVAPRLGTRRLGRARRRGRRRPRHRVRHPGDRRQLLVLHRGAGHGPDRASRGPRSPPTARRSSASTTAPAARCRSAPSPRSCSTRSAARATSAPTSRARFDTIELEQVGARPGADLAARGASRRRRRSRWR